MALCLIIDDNPNNRMVARFICEDIGIDAEEKESALAALDYLSSDAPKPDVLLLDWMMPDMDGIAFLGEMKAKGIELPVIVCSARDAHTYRSQAITAGAVDYLQKPITLDNMRKLMVQVGVLSE